MDILHPCAYTNIRACKKKYVYIYIHVQYFVYQTVYKVFIVVVKKLYIQSYLFIRIPSESVRPN